MRRLAQAILAIFGAAALLPAAQRLSPPERFTLATGIPCIYQKDAVSPTTVVGLFIGGGKSAVPPGLDGLAAVATRILLEIPDEGKVRDLMAQATRLSYVCLEDGSIILVECLTENIEEALRVAAKIVQDPLVSGLRVGRAKELMTANAKIEDDDAVAAGRNAALRALFGGRGYGSTLYGTEAGLKAIDRKDVLAFIRRFVVKPNVFFFVATDLEREPLRRLLETAFDAFPEGPAVEVPRQEPVLPDDRDVLVVKDVKQTYIGRAYALPRTGLKDMAEGYLLETLLGKGPGSRLWTLRADERLAYGVDADLTWMKSAGMLIAYLETGRAKSPEAGAALDRILSALREDGVTEEELAATQTMARGRFLRATEAKSPRLRTLGLFELLGLGTGASSGFLEALQGVTREDLNAFIRAALDPGRAVRIAVGSGPSGKANGAALPEFGADDRHPPRICDRPERRGNGRLGVERQPRPGPVPAADGQGQADQVLIAPAPEELHQVEGETKGYDRFLACSGDLDGIVDVPGDRR
ncbi:MAG: insulinase family protein, partial [Candidatus Aminicenantes bacterium]